MMKIIPYLIVLLILLTNATAESAKIINGLICVKPAVMAEYVKAETAMLYYSNLSGAYEKKISNQIEIITNWFLMNGFLARENERLDNPSDKRRGKIRMFFAGTGCGFGLALVGIIALIVRR